MTNPEHQKITNRLKRVEGQVRGLVRMIDQGDSLSNIFIQTKAIKSALVGIEQKLIDYELTLMGNEISESSRAKISEIQKLLQ